MSDLPPSVGRYRILSRLASDPLGEMFHGFDPLIERPVVVRVFSLRHVDAEKQGTIKEKFYAEMQRTGMLGHHGIAALFDAGELPGGLFVATEFVEGASLADVLTRGVQGELPQRASLLIQLSDALDYAHQTGVPHLCLEPVHVRIDARQMLKIGGFGIAAMQDAIADQGGLPRLISSHYSAPERARRDPCDQRADVFSLARVALDVLCEACTNTSVIPPLPPYLAEQGVQADDWTRVFTRGLAADPAARFDSPVAFTLHLLEMLANGDETRLMWVRSGTRHDLALPEPMDSLDAPEPGHDAEAFVTMLGTFMSPSVTQPPTARPATSNNDAAEAETMIGSLPDAPTVAAAEPVARPVHFSDPAKPKKD